MECERTIIARTKQYLENSYSVKVEVEELEDLLGPDDVDVGMKEGCETFETFSTDGLSEFVVVLSGHGGAFATAP